MRRGISLLSLAVLTICASVALADNPLTQEETHNLGTTETPEYTLDNGRVSEKIIANIAWKWGVYKREDLDSEICTSEQCGRDEHREFLTAVPFWNFRDERLINPTTKELRTGDDLTRELGNIARGVMNDVNLQGALNAATSDIRDAGNSIEFRTLPDKTIKDLAKALDEKRKKVEKLGPKNIVLGHWAPNCHTLTRDFWRNLYALKVTVTLVKHRVVTDRGAAKATDTKIGDPAEGILAVAALDDIKWTDRKPLYCCREGGAGKNENLPKEPPKEEPPKKGEENNPGTHEKESTPTQTPAPKRTPTATSTPVKTRAESPPKNLRATLVGIVWANDSRVGEPATVRVVLDPKAISDHPGLVVHREKVPVPHNSHGKATLTGMVLKTPDGREHPADAPVDFVVPAVPEVLLALTPTDLTTDEGKIKIERRQAPAEIHRPAKENFTMLPVMPADAVCLVHGRFRGDTSATRIENNGEPVEILAQTPRETWFRPLNVQNGPNKVTVTEDGRSTTFEVFAPMLEIRTDRTVMHEGDTANVEIVASALDGMKAEQWRAGAPSEIYNLSSAPAAAMASGSEGKMLLIVKNNSPDVVTMSGAQRNVATVVVSRADILRGDIFHTVLRAHREGTFALEAELRPLLAEVSGETGGGGDNVGTPIATPAAESPKVEGQSEPTEQQKKEFARWWAAAFGYGVAPDLDAKTMAWWNARKAQLDAEEKQKAAGDAYNGARKAAIDSDPRVKQARAEIANLGRVLALPQANDDPEYKKRVERKKADREAELKQAQTGAEEKWKKTKEAAQLEKNLRDADRGVQAARDAAGKLAKDVPESARNSIEDAEKHSAESPAQAEPQEKVIEH